MDATLSAGFFGLLDWEQMTGQSRFVVDIVSIPIFSAIAGLITNWTGVIMLFAPVRFTGFYCPGVKTIFPFLPRKVQILPIFAPGGILGFQGFIPARAEKMASLVTDNAVAKIGTAQDFFYRMDPQKIAKHVAQIAGPNVPAMVEDVMQRENPQLWKELPPQGRKLLIQRVETELPAITDRAFKFIGDNFNQLIDIKLLVVGYMRRRPELMKDIIYGLGAPELKFMVRVGLLGFPFGIVLALWLLLIHYSGPEAREAHEHDPGAVFISLPGWLDAPLHFFPTWLWVLLGAALVGVIVNIIAIKVVFEPATPQPRYKYLWKEAKFARRQHTAAANFGHAIAYQIVTMDVIANELLEGPNGDKTRAVLDYFMKAEINRILGPLRTVARLAAGTQEFDAMMSAAGQTLATEMKPWLVEDVEFSKQTAAKVDELATEKLRELPADEFVEMLYTAIEQDAWLLYLHGGLLGLLVGATHILVFGA
ncbi:hypothetical protein [Skermania piniformis]|uniref:DUF445 domain-containing protein n=1 Tax=Skermania pinensis TaxID=39122 RepID=A0ABX8SER3_9ACTN|nr:hypothetical protein [Skermania piniformis]QXQ15941.1 hypothetical protein KV203_14560 [Skermania piniformis]